MIDDDMNVVVAVDSSEESMAAAHNAAAAAERIEAKLTLVHCVQQSVTNGGSNGPIQESFDDAQTRGQARLEQVHGALSEYDVDVAHELLTGGAPVQSFVEYLFDERPHAVYIGHRDMSEREEALLGSFAKKLIDRSPVPVTVVSGTSLVTREE